MPYTSSRFTRGSQPAVCIGNSGRMLMASKENGNGLYTDISNTIHQLCTPNNSVKQEAMGGIHENPVGTNGLNKAESLFFLHFSFLLFLKLYIFFSKYDWG